MKRQRNTSLRRALRRLTDPQVIGWPLFWLSLAIWMISFYPQVMRGEGPNTPERALTWVLSIGAGQLTVFAILLAAKRLWWHRPWPRRHPAIAVWSFIGSILIGVIVANIVASPILTPAGSLSFGLEHLTLGSLTLIIIGSGVIAVQQHRDAVARLQQTQASLRASIDRGEAVLTTEHEDTLRATHDVIDDAVQAVSAPSSETVSILNAASEDILRPLSHELAYSTDRIQAVNQGTPTPRWRDVLTELTTMPLIAPRLTAFVMLLLAWRFTITNTAARPSQVETNVGGSTVGVSFDPALFGQALMGLASVFIGTWLATRLIVAISSPLLRRFGPTVRWIITGLSVLAAAILSQGLTIAFIVALGVETDLNYSLAVLLALLGPIAAITALVGLLRAVSIAQMGVREDLDHLNQELEWQLARVNQRIWDQRRRLAQTVHGPVRAALISTALELSRSVTTGDPETTQRLQERLSRTREQFFDRPRTDDPLTPLVELRDLWRGTCTISIDCDAATHDLLNADRIAAETACKLAEEACANAIMHGQATSIQICLVAEAFTLTLSVTNNGTPPESGARAGLGTNFLDEVCLYWMFAPSDDGPCLTATLPIENGTAP